MKSKSVFDFRCRNQILFASLVILTPVLVLIPFHKYCTCVELMFLKPVLPLDVAGSFVANLSTVCQSFLKILLHSIAAFPHIILQLLLLLHTRSDEVIAKLTVDSVLEVEGCNRLEFSSPCCCTHDVILVTSVLLYMLDFRRWKTWLSASIS